MQEFVLPATRTERPLNDLTDIGVAGSGRDPIDLLRRHVGCQEVRSAGPLIVVGPARDHEATSHANQLIGEHRRRDQGPRAAGVRVETKQ